jgi:Domain of unknown function (DUF4267)
MNGCFVLPKFVLLNNKQMKTQIETIAWGARSASWWLTLFMAAGIIFIGARFIVAPASGAIGFGIPLNNDEAYGRIKGIRDIFSGVVLLPLLWMGMRKATAFVFTVTTIVPATDFLIVLTHNGITDVQHLLIHGLTVVFMTIISWLLFRKE